MTQARRKGMGDRIAAVHREHPDWPAVRIAAHLDCCAGLVRSTAQRRGLALPMQRQRERRLPPEPSRADDEKLLAGMRLRAAGRIWREIASELGGGASWWMMQLRDVRDADALAEGSS